jgi:hypothetical protein
MRRPPRKARPPVLELTSDQCIWLAIKGHAAAREARAFAARLETDLAAGRRTYWTSEDVESQRLQADLLQDATIKLIDHSRALKDAPYTSAFKMHGPGHTGAGVFAEWEAREDQRAAEGKAEEEAQQARRRAGGSR